MADKHTGFDKRINELQEKRSQLDLSFLQGQKGEYEKRIAELLEAPIDGNESERDVRSKLNEIRECHAKINEINDRIEHIPENAEETIKEIDRKISLYKEKKEEAKNIPLYRDTEEGIAEIFGSDIVQYAKETNNTELMDKLRNRRLTSKEYSRILKQDYPKYRHEKMEEMYTELLFSEEYKPLENGNYSEGEKPSEGGNQENDEQLPKKKRKIEKPRETLSKLDIKYQSVDGIILPTKGNTQTIKRLKAVSQNYKELDQEYEDKINILFSKVLTSENGFDVEDYNVITGMEPKHMVRKTSYVVVELPRENKMIILNNGYGEATFLCDEMFERSLLTSVSKEELVKQHGKNIKKLEFQEELFWVDELLKWLGKDRKIRSEEETKKNVEKKVKGTSHKNVDVSTEQASSSGTVMKVENQGENEENKEAGVKKIIIPDYMALSQEERKEFITEFFKEHYDDFLDELVCMLVNRNWHLFVLRNKKLVSIQKEFFEWVGKNKKLKVSETGWKNKKYSDQEMRDALDLFMNDYFVEKTKKVSELRKIINDDLYKKVETHLSSLQNRLSALSDEEKKENKSEALGLLLAINMDVAIVEKIEKYKEELKPGTIVNDFDPYYELGDLLEMYNDYCVEEKNENERNNKMENLVKKMYEVGMIHREDVKKFLKGLYEKKVLDSEDIENDIKNALILYMNRDRKGRDKNFRIENVEGNFVPVLRIIEDYKSYVEIFKNLGFNCELKGDKNLSSKEENSSKAKNDIIEGEGVKQIEVKSIDDVIKYFKTKGVEINKSDLSSFLRELNNIHLRDGDIDFEWVIESIEKNKYFSFSRLKEVLAIEVLRDRVNKDENDIEYLSKGSSDDALISSIREDTKKGHLGMFKKILRLLECEEKYINEIDNLNAKFPYAVKSYIDKYMKDGALSTILYKDGTFDFLTMQSEILHEVVENCDVDKDVIKDIYRYLGFYIYDDCTLDKMDGNNIIYIQTSLSGIIDYLKGEKRGCFSDVYYGKKSDWQNLGSLKECSLFYDKKNPLKGSFLKSEQGYRIGVIYKNGYYMVIELFKHDEHENDKGDGWINKRVSKKEADAFLSATGVKI